MDRHRIRATEATIYTAAVDVKVLRIGTKRMTLSVFRQLIEECPIDWELLDVKGPIWGIVNYFWGDYLGGHDDAGNPIALQVVWKNGQELRRAYMHALGPDRFETKRVSSKYGWQSHKASLPGARELWDEVREMAREAGQLFIAL
jgi:hypothetical protein